MTEPPIFTYHALAPLEELPWNASLLPPNDEIDIGQAEEICEQVTERVVVTGDSVLTNKAPEEQADDFIPLEASAEEGSIETGPETVASAGSPQVANGSDYVLPPWVQSSTRRIRSPLLRLHQEIVDFCNFLTPTEEEKAARDAALKRVNGVIMSIWPHSKPCVFGSFATGLFLPTSDVDVVVLDSNVQPQQGLRALAKALSRCQMAKKMQVIAKARVPIVKFVEVGSGLSFDVSFDVANGPQAADFIRRAMEALPPLRPLCLIVKIFLQQRELNEVYSGGIGSYALLVMLMAHLQLHPSRRHYASGGQKAPLDANLGVLLVDFLELYGRTLHAREVGVSCRQGGAFYSKREHGMLNSERPWLLSVEDPQQPDNDIGKNSYNVQKVRSAFLHAHHLLTSAQPGDFPANAGLLERIVRLDTVLLERKVPSPPKQPCETGTLVEEQVSTRVVSKEEVRQVGRRTSKKALKESHKLTVRKREPSEEGEIEEETMFASTRSTTKTDCSGELAMTAYSTRKKHKKHKTD